MRTIAIDGNEANVEKRVGVSVYTLKLLEYFQTQANEDLRFLVYLKHPPLSDLPKKSPWFEYCVIRAPFLWSQIFLPLHLFKLYIQKQTCDVFFSPAHYAPRFLFSKSVVTIHDVSYLFFPDEFLKRDLYQLTHWTKYSIMNAAKVICVSKTTKKDVLHNYHVPEEKVKVIYNGFEKSNRTMKKSDNINKKPYILYVGTIQPRKNIEVLLEAFAVFFKKHPDFQLLVVGKKGWLSDSVFQSVSRLNLDSSVRFLGFVSDRELISLYSHAFCFVLPSLYEGFGIPLLEAMHFGCPTIASFTASLPEVGGEASLYFDPKSPSELTEKLELLFSDVKLRTELVQKGKKQITQFSWETCAQQTLNILQSI